MINCLHGFLGSYTDWRPFSKDFVGIDYLESWEGLASINDIASSLDLENDVTLVGYSLGARVAWTYANLNPEKIEKLILISGEVFTKEVSSFRALAIEALEEKGLQGFYALWNQLDLFNSYAMSDFRAAHKLGARTWSEEKIIHSLENWGQTPVFDVAQLPFEVHYIYGAKDKKYSEQAYLLKSQIKATHLHKIENVGHRCIFEDFKSGKNILTGLVY